MQRALALVSIALIASCAVEHHVTVSTIELHKHLVELRAKGQVEVAAAEMTESDYSTRHDRREVIRLDDGLGTGDARFPVSEIVHGCPDAPPPVGTPPGDGDCPLISFGQGELEIRHYTSRSIRTAGGYALGALFLGSLVGGIACGIGCPAGTPEKTASEVVVGVYGVALVALLVLGIASCVGHWGSFGCHD